MASFVGTRGAMHQVVRSEGKKKEEVRSSLEGARLELYSSVGSW